jgi:hypothetical protein
MQPAQRERGHGGNDRQSKRARNPHRSHPLKRDSFSLAPVMVNKSFFCRQMSKADLQGPP